MLGATQQYLLAKELLTAARGALPHPLPPEGKEIYATKV
jgi:hypothetical protein